MIRRTPVVEELSFPLSPVEAFELLRGEEHSFFLDSGMNLYSLGRYSFMGSKPFLIFKSKGKHIEVIEAGDSQHHTGSPFHVLREILGRYRVDCPPELPPFLGGAVGYFGYDLCHFIERLPSRNVDDLNLPDCYLAFYDVVLIFDHFKRKTYISSCGFERDGGKHLKELKRRLLSGPWDATLYWPTTRDRPGSVSGQKRLSLISNFTKEGYLNAVRRAKDYIGKGDIYQVNLSQRFSTRLSTAPFELYKRLRSINPAPFASFLNFDGVGIVGASPERFLRLRGRKVETRPMKGTRPRGKGLEEDSKLKEELLGSEKDKAELVMIVDVERNDLGRVCEYGSVRVTERRTLEPYATVFQTTATIEGELREGKDSVDLLKATFPGGSITGAPKVRAMEIIDELEPTKRSIYTGSIGYLSFSGALDLNIVIRTFILKDGRAYFQVGGGIVADSWPEAEYRETLDKAKALLLAVSEEENSWLQEEVEVGTKIQNDLL